MSDEATTDVTDLQIIGAVYGLAKVTSLVIGLVNRSASPQSLNVTASNAVFGDTWPGTRKTLTVAYRYGTTGNVGVAVVREGDRISIGQTEYQALLDAGQGSAETPKLGVLGATYGPGNITDKLRSMINQQDQTLSATANNATFGDTWPNVPKVMVVVAAYEGQVPFVDIVQEGSAYALKYRPPLRIISGYFGLKDVTDRVRAAVRQRNVSVRATDDVFGDGWPGVPKTLAVVYQYGNEQQQLNITPEGSTVIIDYTPRPPAGASPDPNTLNVIRAAYGKGEVTAKVQSMISAQQALNFIANNATFSDTWPNTRKSFSLTYSWGPGTCESLVTAEGQAVSLARPPITFTQELISIAGLVADGDFLALKAANGSYLTPDPATGRLLAAAPERTAGTHFTARVTADQPDQITLVDSTGRPVIVGPDGTLTASAGGTAAHFVLSLTKAGSVTMGVLGSGKNFSIVQADGSVLAGGTDITTFEASYALELEPTEEGTENLLRAFGVADANVPIGPLLTVVWDLTGGFFTAIGLGPLMAGGTRPATGILALIRSNAVASAALDALISAVRNNLEATIGLGTLFSFVATLWDAGIMMKVFRLALNTAGWWLIGWAVAKLLEWALLPEAAAAELVASFGIWAYQTTRDVIALVNAMSGTPMIPAQFAGVDGHVVTA